MICLPARIAHFRLWLILAIAAGCSGAKLKTHPVAGKVELKDGDVAILKGSTIELEQEADSKVRASGVIEADGSFRVKTFHAGEFLAGAPEGKYKARIILGDESDEGVPKRKGNPVHPRYFDFEKSGLSVSVPAADITVPLSKK